jgi:hypothetical protein
MCVVAIPYDSTHGKKSYVIVPKLVKRWLNGCGAVGNRPTTHKKQGAHIICARSYFYQLLDRRILSAQENVGSQEAQECDLSHGKK